MCMLRGLKAWSLSTACNNRGNRVIMGSLRISPCPFLMLLKTIILFHPRVICKQWTTSFVTQTVANNLMFNSPVKKVLGEGEVTIEVTLIRSRKTGKTQCTGMTSHSVWEGSTAWRGEKKKKNFRTWVQLVSNDGGKKNYLTSWEYLDKFRLMRVKH